ncbi:CPBP family intramembrane glutamic endopeptidase [Sphingobacterium hungaricum]|uniref:CPBP family intramembrane metalloprotease domain-containing protein n=1 Tax=Sphingobacterium hungaricum TaxID=2082723 RepID=A0A928UTG8_9SPHI|nr:CPBP family intramembrane glutamic endopeptidase [Sphingobacterium hungaricum]MBE8712915.1 CPBP family intramembrane metalloprotease domain-containing protein [Sphingobacterium hungaricum]
MQQKPNSPWYSLMILLILTLALSVFVSIALVLIEIIRSGSLHNFVSNGQTFSFGSIESEWALYLFLACGSIGTFFLPAYFLQRIEKDQVIYFPKDSAAPAIYGLVFLFLLAFSPLMGIIGEWNMNMTLPKSFEALETWMKTQEDQMAGLTERLVMVTSWGSLFANLLVMALIPAIVEEYYFRGVLQNIAQRIVINPHVAIFITAIIFSAIHVQFYGFFPRMILGVFFGYLMLWSNNIWAPIFAHFVNNASVTIIAFYYAQQGKTYQDLMSMDSYSIFVYIASLVLSIAFGYLIFKLSNKKQPTHGEELDESQNIYERN